MSDYRRNRGLRNSSPLETIVESLRDYTSQVEQNSRNIQRHRSRLLLVSYLLISFFLIFLTATVYVLGKNEVNDPFLATTTLSLIVLSLTILPITAVNGYKRYLQYKDDLKRSIAFLSQTARFASQLIEHTDLEKIEKVLLELRLSEASTAIIYANTLLREKQQTQPEKLKN